MSKYNNVFTLKQKNGKTQAYLQHMSQSNRPHWLVSFCLHRSKKWSFSLQAWRTENQAEDNTTNHIWYFVLSRQKTFWCSLMARTPCFPGKTTQMTSMYGICHIRSTILWLCTCFATVLLWVQRSHTHTHTHTTGRWLERTSQFTPQMH